MPKACINYALAGTLIAKGFTYDQAAPKCGAKNGATLMVGLHRKGVKANKVRNMDTIQEESKSITLRVVSQASELLKEKYANILDKTADALGNIPIVANTKSLKELGEAAEPFVRMAKVVHGWGDETAQGLAMVGLYDQHEQNTAIPVESSVTSPPQALPDNSSVSPPNTDQAQ